MSDEKLVVGHVSQLTNECMTINDKLRTQFPEAVRFHELLEKEAHYSALLAVLRQCVESGGAMLKELDEWDAAVATIMWVEVAHEWVNKERHRAALTAARPYIERKEGETH
ncbi:MAG TPA: hypothetical protein VJ553_00955 [Candidatus Paceibacterota bacterium]|nr:hypothetical protein [Candidatus Paceibacterota bacterium]